MKVALSVLCISLLLASPASADDAALKAGVDRIIKSALAGNNAYERLTELCDDIGHRLSGSKQLDRAIEWAKKVLKKDGHENVRGEKVMIPKWVRGKESATMILPRKKQMTILGLGGSVGTPRLMKVAMSPNTAVSCLRRLRISPW